MYEIGDLELEAIKRVFERRKLFRYQAHGPGECDLFETEFAAVLGTPHAILLSSGTNALFTALAASGIGPGDEVIIPSYTFVATAAAVVQAGAIPVIANIDETLGMCAEDAARKVTDRTRAIIPVHMDGLAADLDGILQIARDKSLVVIEDVAQAIGGSYKGRHLGTFGSFGCFSLNENKHISCGEGGVVVTADRELFERAFCLHDTASQFNPVKKETYTKITPFVGSSMRVSEILGAIMRVQLGRLEGILAGLRERKRIFIDALAAVDSVRVLQGACAQGDCGSSLHLLFEDPLAAAQVGKSLRDKRILFAPVTTRPAHVSWKWSHLLGEHSSWHALRNPYKHTDRKYSYPTADFLPSISLLTRTLRMEIDLALSLEETRDLAAETIEILTSKPA
jgi:dTDP-4-amino-4,6-dideoxygalactose transaminase